MFKPHIIASIFDSINSSLANITYLGLNSLNMNGFLAMKNSNQQSKLDFLVNLYNSMPNLNELDLRGNNLTVPNLVEIIL